MITSHVVSLELAKKLKEIGYPQNSAFYHVNDGSESDPQWVTVYRGWTNPSSPSPTKSLPPSMSCYYFI